MSELRADMSHLLEGLTEAALIVASGRLVAANAAARALLGTNIASAPVEQVISHPAALAALQRGDRQPNEDVELTGLGGSRRHWLMRVARLANGTSLIRFVDRSEARAAEQMRVDFVAN